MGLCSFFSWKEPPSSLSVPLKIHCIFAFLDGNPHFLEARGKTFACHCSQTLHSNNNKILIDLFVIAAAMWIALSIQQIASIVIPPPIYIYVLGQGLWNLRKFPPAICPNQWAVGGQGAWPDSHR